MQSDNSKKNDWLDQPANVQKLVYGLYAVCAAVLIAGVFLPHEGHFGFESWFGFYGLFSFAACCLAVGLARVLRMLLRRPEDYYDR